MKLDTLQFFDKKNETPLPVLKEKNKNDVFYSFLFQVPGQDNSGLFFNEKSASKSMDGQKSDGASIAGTLPLKAGMSAIFADMLKGNDAKEIKYGPKTTKFAEPHAAKKVNTEETIAVKNNNPGFIKTNTAQIITINSAGSIENTTRQDVLLMPGGKPAVSTENSQKPEGAPAKGIEFFQPGLKNILSKPELNAYENIEKLLEYGNAGTGKKAGLINDMPEAKSPSLQPESPGGKENFSSDIKNLSFFFNLKGKDSQLYSYTENSALSSLKLKSNSKELKDMKDLVRENTGINSGSTQDIAAGSFVSKHMLFAERLPNLENISSVVFETVRLNRPQGASELELDLEPEYLGKLKIKVTSRNEKIDIIIKASVASTGDMLRDNIQALKDSLAERGLDLNQVSVGMEEQYAGRGHSFSGFGDKNGQDYGIDNVTGRILNDNAGLSILDIANIGSDSSLYLNKLI